MVGASNQSGWNRVSNALTPVGESVLLLFTTHKIFHEFAYAMKDKL
jgi:hypothetical protein